MFGPSLFKVDQLWTLEFVMTHQMFVSEMDLFDLMVCVGLGIHQALVSEMDPFRGCGRLRSFRLLFLKWVSEMFMVDFELNHCLC